MENINRNIQKDLVYLNIAKEIATLSYCERKKVGCIIVKNENIISTGFNGTPTGMNNCCEDNENGETLWYVLHAESNAITKLAKSTQNCEGATLYITLSPCQNCAKLILQSGIERVVMLNKHSCQSGIEFLKEQGIICEYISELINS